MKQLPILSPHPLMGAGLACALLTGQSSGLVRQLGLGLPSACLCSPCVAPSSARPRGRAKGRTRASTNTPVPASDSTAGSGMSSITGRRQASAQGLVEAWSGPLFQKGLEAHSCWPAGLAGCRNSSGTHQGFLFSEA